jgi:hypothetical protein
MRIRKQLAAVDGGPQKSPPLRTLFPRVSLLRVELDFVHDAEWSPSAQVHILYPPSTASFRYPCPVAGCNGAFELSHPVAELLQRSKSVLSDHATCEGVRPVDRVSGRLCALKMKYRIEATYG